DGVDLDTLLRKRTAGLMQQHLKPKIDAATRQQFPQGIASYGADALRFTFAALATTGRDIRFDMSRIDGYAKFCNKLWNASLYVLMSTEEVSPGEASLSPADRWIRSRLQRTTNAVHEHFAGYRLDLAAQALYDFTWHEFCDWYLELSKPVLQSGESDASSVRGAQKTLVEVLETLLRLLHPLMPFITEEIWLEVAERAGKSGETVMLQPYPPGGSQWQDVDAEGEMDWVRQFILGVRQIRGEMNISPGKPLPVLLQQASEQDRTLAERHRHLLSRVGRIESIRVLDAEEAIPPSATALLGNMRLLVPMKGAIDVDAERLRLMKQQEKLSADLRRSRQKLDNSNFVNNAPADVVSKESDRAAELRRQIGQLEEQLAKLDALA
ncbi:MAG: class I tRNA ligase family protein, partial [Woeseia sp.]